ncbi:MAG: hypothetical protein LBT14_06345 [Treponema sp.]|jgi:hypothetical protein|nr:hypothetical protein [Treponema sp.]
MEMRVVCKPIWQWWVIYLLLVTVTSCIHEYGSFAEVTFVNHSSYDLHLLLTFEQDFRGVCNFDTNNIKIEKKQNISLTFVAGFSDIAPEVNYGIKTITFSNLTDDTTIVTKENDNLFVVTGGEKTRYGGEEVYYRMEITDELLRE